MNTKELLPCPFCGNDKIDPEGWSNANGDSGPQCFYVPAGLAASIGCGATAESIEAWNRRAAPNPEASGELIAKGRQLLALRDKATPGPWLIRWKSNSLHKPPPPDTAYTFGDFILNVGSDEGGEQEALDIEFLCAAHELADWIAAAMPMLGRRAAVDDRRCQCQACKRDGDHDAGCAVHNAPAYAVGACDCGLHSTLESLPEVKP